MSTRRSLSLSSGTNHFAHAVAPAEGGRAAQYHDCPYVGEIARAIRRVVGLPFGGRPFRVHLDLSEAGAEVVNGVADRVRAEMLRRIGLEDLLSPVVKA